jgi:RES domain
MTSKGRSDPPKDIAERQPRFVNIDKGRFYRFYPRGLNPIFFDRSTDGRFNSPNASFGVLYAAKRLNGAFAETFLRSPGRTLLPEDLIAQKARVRLRLVRPLRLVRFYGQGLSVLGATAEVVASPKPYNLPQQWAAALHNHPGMFDGIAYRARHDDDEICYAFFERSSRAIEEVDREEKLDADWFYKLMQYYSVGLAP